MDASEGKAAIAASELKKLDWIGAVDDEYVMYSDVPADYTRLSPIGYGASSVVYQAIFHRKDQSGKVTDYPCALKVLHLDKLAPSALKLLTRETQLMSLSKHPNVLRVRGSWMMGPQLYIATRFMKKGSVADIIKYSFIDGLEEDVVKCILYQALQGLNYLHVNGFIHRDIKAANLLVDDDGTVLLGDLGVAVSLADDEDTGQNGMMSAVRKGFGSVGSAPLVYGARSNTPSDKKNTKIGKRKSFVGTPSWMAPEVISQQHYDASADIWSLGITVLEMCNGRAPGSRERDVKRVLLGTLQNAPPTLDREGGTFKYSKALKDFVESCLVKDADQRPTVERLLKHDFFKGVKKKSFLVTSLLANLPPISERQERVVVNKNQPHKPKVHPLALGSPSLTSIHDHSWHWNFSNPGSPRSTVHSKHGSTPPGSIRSPTAGGENSPSESLVSLHRDQSTPMAPERAGSTPRSRSRTSSSFEIRSGSISPSRMRRHSRVPSYVPPDLAPEMEVEGEGEGDDEMKGIDAQLEKLGVGLASPGDEDDATKGDPEEAILATPHVHAVVGFKDPEALALQPPGLSSSSSSASPKMSTSSLTRQLTDNASVPATPSSSPEQSPSVLDRGSTSNATERAPRSSRLWKKVKSAAGSTTTSKKSQTNLRPAPSPVVAGGEPERKASFSAKAALMKSWSSKG